MSKTYSRREFGVSGAAALVGAVGAARATGETAPAAQRPNVLVIHTDQHRIDCLGAYGNPDLRTPNIDRLAAEGTRFENSFCPYPVCTPSRYSLLCGRYVHEHRGWSNHSTLEPGTPTFASVLRGAGYRTKAVGKMHFTPTYLDVGFDNLMLAEQNGPGRWDDDYHRVLRAEGLVDRIDMMDQLREFRKEAPQTYWETFGAMAATLPPELCSTQWIGDRAVEDIETWEGGGHLLMAGFIKPHHPFDPPKDWCDRYNPDELELLPGWIDACLERDEAMSKGYFPNAKLTEPALRRVMAYYYATIEHIDEQAGRMISLLERKGLYDSTLIVFTSDHGEYMGFHHLLLKSNYLYDPLAKVPLIVKYPGKTERKASPHLVSNVDVAPTIIAAAGLKQPPSMSGLDLGSGTAPRDVVFAENRGGRHVMARSASHKLILTDGARESLLFDLEADPLELTNRVGDIGLAEVEQDLKRAIHEWRPEAPSKAYVDEDAPQISAPNVPVRGDGHKADMEAYFTRKMAE